MREVLALRPVEIAAVHDKSANAVAVTAKEFCSAVNNNSSTMFKRAAQRGRRHRIVNDQRNARRMGNIGNTRNILHRTAWVGEAFNEDTASLIGNRGLHFIKIIRIDKSYIPRHFFERIGKLVKRSAIKLFGSNDMRAGVHQYMKDQHLRRMARCHSKGSYTALHSRNLAFKRGIGR